MQRIVVSKQGSGSAKIDPLMTCSMTAAVVALNSMNIDAPMGTSVTSDETTLGGLDRPDWQ